MKKIRFNFLTKSVFVIVLFIFFLGSAKCADPTFNQSAYDLNYNLSEDAIYYHDFKINLTGGSDFSHFSILDISWEKNGEVFSGDHNYSNFYWISWNDSGFSNSTSGVLKINATRDNETGNFTINVHVQGSPTGHSAKFKFIVNATNDFPFFTNINSSYEFFYTDIFESYINASDELNESHYPLYFEISWINNCTHASWSGRNNNENCSLSDFGFNITSVTDTASLMNFTPSLNDVGVYWANITVFDSGENYICPHQYCDSSEYQKNQTGESRIVRFNILSDLFINVSNCTDSVFQENQSNICYINVTTRYSESNITSNSNASLRNGETPDYVNRSWFFSENTTTSINYVQTFLVNVTPGKKEVGNWTINFSVFDNDYSSEMSELVYIYVNRTYNALPEISEIENRTISINQELLINFNVSDNDFLIPDKNSGYGGYNETVVLGFNITNIDGFPEKTIQNVSINVLQMPVTGGNYSTAIMIISPNSTESGNYTIVINATDLDGAVDFVSFNLTVFNNTAPQWILPLETNFTYIEYDSVKRDTRVYLNLSQNVTDSEGDNLTFSYSYIFNPRTTNFNLNSNTGIIDFNLSDIDVGEHIIDITVSDGFLSNTTRFNFTVYNKNDAPEFFTMACSPVSCSSPFTQVNFTEDSTNQISIHIMDYDLDIPSSQVNYWSESISVVNTTIINSTGQQNDLFNFSYSTTGINNTIWVFVASFTPAKIHVGEYNVSVYFRDVNNSLVSHFFNLTINPINHNPTLIGADTNKSSGVNRTFYFDFNVTDIEDLNDSVSDVFRFGFDFIYGDDFINSNESIFNTTTGILNITFNESHAGRYHVNVSVNDSENLTDFGDFWIFVYDFPSVLSPSGDYIFNLKEAEESGLNFSANHSVQDNLTFLFYVDSILCSYLDNTDCVYGDLVLRNNLSYFGNTTNYSWMFTPNYSDETYGLYKNLTLVVYPSNSELEDNFLLNTTVNWRLNTTHTNAPVIFSGYIPNLGPIVYTEVTEIDLSNYFSDYDYDDPYYRQSLLHDIQSNSSSYLTSGFSDWILTIGASRATEELINITLFDDESNSTSNNFVIRFINPVTEKVTTARPSSSGGTSTLLQEVLVLFKLVLPGPVSAFSQDQIILPIELQNNGEMELKGIDLSGSVAKDGILRDDFSISFSPASVESLMPGQSRNVTAIVDVNTTGKGFFELTINASVTSPKISDWGKIYITIEQLNEYEERLLFIGNYILENPQCAELTEVLEKAQGYLEKGDVNNAILYGEKVIDACKKIVYSYDRKGYSGFLYSNVYKYLWYSNLAILLSLFAYYFYKRHKLKNIKRDKF